MVPPGYVRTGVEVLRDGLRPAPAGSGRGAGTPAQANRAEASSGDPPTAMAVRRMMRVTLAAVEQGVPHLHQPTRGLAVGDDLHRGRLGVLMPGFFGLGVGVPDHDAGDLLLPLADRLQDIPADKRLYKFPGRLRLVPYIRL